MGFDRILTSACVAGALLTAGATTVRAVPVFALTDDNTLLSFDSATPASLTGVAPIKNGANQEIQNLIGIDFRPSTNELYGVGKLGGIYTINLTTAVATQVGSLTADAGDGTSPFTQLFGSRFGFDFNPVVDRLRIVSDTDQNLRINVGTGATFTDTSLAYDSANTLADGDPIDVNVGQNPSIIGSAYTNNFAGAISTTLYGIDSVLNTLAIQGGIGGGAGANSPNNGVLNTVGSLSFDTSSLVGLDVLTVGGTDTAYAALQNTSNGISQLFTINLATGTATLVGPIGGGDFIDGIAVAIPEPGSIAGLMLLTTTLLARRRNG